MSDTTLSLVKEILFELPPNQLEEFLLQVQNEYIQKQKLIKLNNNTEEKITKKYNPQEAEQIAANLHSDMHTIKITQEDIEVNIF